MVELDDRIFNREARFEAERVDCVIKACRMDSYRDSLYQLSAQKIGVRILKFEFFYDLFPTFPVRLMARYDRRLCTGRPGAFYRALAGGSAWKAYQETRDDFDRSDKSAAKHDTRPIGLIVPMDRYPGGFVLHDAVTPAGGARWTAEIVGGPPHRLTFEPFQRFLKYLAASQWTPDDHSDGVVCTVSRWNSPATFQEVLSDLRLEPRLLVLCWIARLLRSSESSERCFVHRLDVNTRCVVGGDEAVANAIGLSPRQVRRALTDLRSQGLIEPVRKRQGFRAVVVSDRGHKAVEALVTAVRPDLEKAGAV